MPDMVAILMPAFLALMAAITVVVLALMFVGGRLARRDEALVRQHMPRKEAKPAYREAA